MLKEVPPKRKPAKPGCLITSGDPRPTLMGRRRDESVLNQKLPEMDFNVKHLTGLDIRNALIKHIGSKDLVIAQSEIEIFERAALNPGLELTVLELLELRLPGHHCLTQVIPNVSVTHQAATVVSVFRSLCSKP